MVHSCAVVGCTNNSNKNKGMSFHSIPSQISSNHKHYKFHPNKNEIIASSIKRQDLWVSSLKRGTLTDTQLRNAEVCAIHFISGKPASLLDKNNPDWVPSQHMGYKVGFAVKKQSSFSRYQRALNRANTKEINFKLPCEDSGLLNECGELVENVTNEIECLECQDVANNNPESKIQNPEHEPNEKDGCTQTVMSMIELNKIFEDLKMSADVFNNLSEALNELYHLPESFKGNDSKTLYFTGFASHEMLFAVHEAIAPYYNNQGSALSTFQQLVLSLMKLRLNLPNTYLAHRFGIEPATVSKYFRRCIHIIYRVFKKLIYWPDPETLKLTMPSSFKENFSTRISGILDCFEVFIECPCDLDGKAACWSNYKHHLTAKVLLYITPQGSVSFVSEGWGGRTSDKYLTENCGFLDKVRPGDCVMADRGFTIKDALQSIGAKLEIPAFTKGKSQLDPEEIESTRSIANVRIHVERVIGSIRQKFQILSSILPSCMLNTDDNGISIFDEMVAVCCIIVNLVPSVVSLD